MNISRTQKQLINLLYENSKIPYTELVKKLGKSRQTIWQYIKDLKQNGYNFERIKLMNPNREDNRIFFVEIKTNPEEPEIISKLSQLYPVKAIDGIIGTTSLMVKFQVHSNEEFRNTLKEIDAIITESRFQFYHIINILNVFKEAGHVFCDDLDEVFHTIKLYQTFIPNSDFPYKWYLHLIPKKLPDYTRIANEILAQKNQIINLYRTGEEFGLLAIVRTKTKEEYRDFIQDLYVSGEFQDSKTIFVLDERLPSTFQPFRI